MQVVSDVPPFDQLKPLSHFTRHFNRTLKTLTNYVVHGTHGGTVRLRAWKVGGYKTTEEAVQEFIKQDTQASLTQAAATVPAVNTSAHKLAKQKLTNAGFGKRKPAKTK